MESKQTKSCRNILTWLSIIHVLLLIGPFGYFLPYSLSNGEESSKITCTVAATIALILFIFSLLKDVEHRAGLYRTIVWVLVAGIIVGVGELDKTFIFTMMGVSVLDELVIIPLKTVYKTKLITNKEIDKRGV